MKNPIIAAFLCLIFMVCTGFGQVTTSSGSLQIKGSSIMMSPDGKTFTGTATFGPPVFSLMIVPGTPFSAEEIPSQTQVPPDGNRITHAMQSVFLYRDSSGRTRTERPAMIMTINSKLASKVPLIAEVEP